MKNITFAIGLAWLLWGALTLGYPDWDVGVSLLMAASTYLFADWCWLAIVRVEPSKWAAVVFYTWWCVDGSYTVYWGLLQPSVMIREGQWPMSLCLFLLAGAVWANTQTLTDATVRARDLVKAGWRRVRPDKAEGL